MKPLRSPLPAVLLTASLFLLPAWVSMSRSRPDPVPAAAPPEVVKTGVVTGWRVKSDGTVYFRLEGRHDEVADDGSPEVKVRRAGTTAAAARGNQEPTFSLWFVTPASQTTTKQFEFMVLHAALHLHRMNLPADIDAAAMPKLTVSSTPTEMMQGRSPEDAMPVDWVAQL